MNNEDKRGIAKVIDIESIYTYKNNEYIVLETGIMKNPYSRKWEDCVMYRKVNFLDTYVRQTQEFLDRFEKV